ncbi:TPA: protein ren [Escherichia coli]|nr:protein ren [Escherichia coli]
MRIFLTAGVDVPSARLTGATVTSINQAAAKMARAGILVIDGKVWRTVYYRFATREEREGKVGTNLIFKECRQSAAMKRVLAVYGDMNLNLL